MSVFRVKLNNTSQGLLDIDPTTGLPFEVSVQRTFMVSGPGNTYRSLKDGDQFTDCNYWKRFAEPQMSADEAFIEVVDDDGSVYSDDSTFNSYAMSYDLTALGGSEYEDNVVDIEGDTGAFAVFTQITNKSEDQAVSMRINGAAVLDLPADSTQIFNYGDLSITLLEFDNSTSGADDADINVFVSVRSVCNS